MSDFGKIFVYGTLRPSGRTDIRKFLPSVLGRSLEDLITNETSAATTGILLMDNRPAKQYPFLVTDPEMVARFTKKTGIKPFEIIGTVFDVVDPEVIITLDQYEGVMPPDRLTDPFQHKSMYETTMIDVETDNGIEKVFAYTANPRWGHAIKLVSDMTKKIVIPHGDWVYFNNARKLLSARVEPEKEVTFGMETEHDIILNTPQGYTSIKKMRDGLTIQATNQTGTDQVYERLTPLVIQCLHNHLVKRGIGSRVRKHFFERSGRVNPKTVIPGGVVYVDREHITKDGAKEGIKTVKSGTPKKPERRRAHEDTYIEHAAFPVITYPGFASSAVRGELQLRWQLAQAVEEGIKVVKNKFPVSHLHAHSSQYNVFLETIVKKEEPFSTALVPQSPLLEGIEKFTQDIAYVFGKTFGILPAYLLAGSEESFIECRPRPGGRLEFRSSPVHDAIQLMAGIAVYVAAVRTTEQLAKAMIPNESSGEEEKKAAREELLKIKPKDYLYAFPFEIKGIDYSPPEVRAGHRINQGQGYLGAIYQEPHGKIKVIDQVGTRKVPLQEILKELYHHPLFADNLRRVTTPKEQAYIDQFINGERMIEAAKTTPAITGQGTKAEWEIFTRDISYRNYQDFVSSFLFEENGERVTEDDSHRLKATLVTKGDYAHISLGAVPMQISLEKWNGRRWSNVDHFQAEITPHNYERLQTKLDNADKKRLPMWEAYFSLK